MSSSSFNNKNYGLFDYNIYILYWEKLISSLSIELFLISLRDIHFEILCIIDFEKNSLKIDFIQSKKYALYIVKILHTAHNA